MSDDCPVVAGLFWFSVGALLFGFFFVMLRNRREAENLPTSTCRAVPMGLVEVAGTVAGAPFRSPFGHVPCLCSRLVVEEWREHSRTPHWHEIYSERFSTPFYVDDGTARVRVDPVEADLHLEVDYSFDMVRGLQAGPAAIEKLRLAGFDAEGVLRRLQEFAGKGGRDAVPEATLAALHVGPRPRGDLTAQIFARGLAAARAFQDLPRLLMSRKPRLPPGIRPLRMHEENLCTGDRVFVLGTARTANDTGPLDDRIVIGRGELHPWFAIGESSQKDVLGRMLRHAWVIVAVGVLLMIAGLRMLMDCIPGP